MERFDAIIIGAGQAGGPLSTALGESGMKTAIIERSHAGGTCVNAGCTPTKTMIASARVAHLVGRAADFGVDVASATIDLNVVRQRKRAIVESFRSGSEAGIRAGKNVELIYGEARFTSPSSVSVAVADEVDREMTAPTIVINAGGRPRRLEVPGLDETGPLTSTSIMELGEVPGRLLIVGAGAIGLEFGQMFRRFGSEVTILSRGPRVLSREDEDVSDAISEILTGEGVRLKGEAELVAVERRDGQKVAKVRMIDTEAEVAFDEILIAAGRVPNSDRLGVEVAGVKTDRQGHIVVDEFFETCVPGIYSVGDINGGPSHTHIAYDDFRILRDILVNGCRRSREDRLLPYTIFIDPQLGRVGLTETEARASGIDVQVFRLSVSSVARALEVDETRGFMKAIVDRSTGEIVGASVLSIEGGEIAGAIQVAMMGGLHYRELRDGTFSHPTLLESLNNLFSSPVED